MLRIFGASTEIHVLKCAEISHNSSAGIVFIEIENLFLEGLTFDHCGTLYDYSKVWVDDYRISFRAAIHILNSTNAVVRNVNISMSDGAGMVIANVHGGIINVSKTTFEHNTIPEADKRSYAGGGGIFVRLQHRYPSQFFFDNCTFVGNVPSTTGDLVFANVFGDILKGRGQGGGLLVRVSDQATNSTITISKCNFTRNSAFFGGGLSIEMSGHSHNNLAMVRDSHFEENGCQTEPVTGSAGGAHLGYSFDVENSNGGNNMIVVNNSVFVRNCAELGGGTTFFANRNKNFDSTNGVQFINCTWIENSGHIGAAVDISPHTDDRLSVGFLPTPEFRNCSFTNNSVSFRKTSDQQPFSSGCLFSSLFDVNFDSTVVFEHNTGSALIVVNGVANFSTCNATFVNNKGAEGGAISLVGVSSMVVGPGYVYKFLHNNASDRGGAISSYLIDEHDFTASHSCFIQYSSKGSPAEWNATLIFEGNDAPYGKSIYTTTVTACQLSGVTFNKDSEIDAKSLTWNASQIFQWPGVFVYDDSKGQVATDGAHCELCNQEAPFEIIPGEEYTLPVNITDDLDHVINATIKVRVNRGAPNIEVDEAFSYVEDKNIRLRGEVGETGELALQLVSPRKISFLVNITMAPCPVGYNLSYSTSKCECDVDSYEGLTKCNDDSLTVYIEEGFWAGYLSNQTNQSLTTAICPVEFCNYNGSDASTNILLPRTSSNVELDNFICGPNRTGVLCGNCKTNSSVYFHSPYFKCDEDDKCNVGLLLYVLSELVPATILFVVMLLFNVSFTSGNLNGFILFSQLLDTLFIDASEVVHVPDLVESISQGYRIIYGFFSLNFFTIESWSFCLWKDATVLDVLAFKYVTIAYSLILIMLVIIFMKYFARRLFGKCIRISAIEISVIHGLSAFLVICYMQSVKVSLNILLPQSLEGKSMSSSRVWLSGEIEMFSDEHLPYALPALLCLLTLGAIPPVLLLAYPLNTKIASYLNININHETHSCLARVSKALSLGKLKPILDSFQGCFKDNLRFFAGLYFLYRWVGLLAYAVSPSLNEFYAILQLLLLIILMVHAVAHPYEKRWHNILDALLFTNLSLINLCSGFNYYYTRVTATKVRNKHTTDGVASFQLSLIYLPIVYIAGFLIVKVWKKYRSWKTRKNSFEFTPIEDFPARVLNEDTNGSQEEEDEHAFLKPGIPAYIPPAYGGT